MQTMFCPNCNHFYKSMNEVASALEKGCPKCKCTAVALISITPKPTKPKQFLDRFAPSEN